MISKEIMMGKKGLMVEMRLIKRASAGPQLIYEIYGNTIDFRFSGTAEELMDMFALFDELRKKLMAKE